MHPDAERFVEQARERHGFDPAVEEFPAGTETAADAADAVGCAVADIASSIVLVADGDPLVAVTSGANRVDTGRVADLLGADAVRMADPDEAEAATGWKVGGVPPFCHAESLPVLLDETLTDRETVWAAAGAPTAVFPVPPAELVDLSGAEVAATTE